MKTKSRVWSSSFPRARYASEHTQPALCSLHHQHTYEHRPCVCVSVCVCVQSVRLKITELNDKGGGELKVREPFSRVCVCVCVPVCMTWMLMRL